jgi:uncharacterized membrane protein (UPF0127 family)
MRVIIVSLFLALSACAQRPYVVLNGSIFEVEIADDDGERTLGLMFRTEMAEDHGMLFIFPNEAPRSFWMKNTRIPLDILYFDSEQILVSMQQDVPPCRTPQCPGYPSEGPARYVLELNAGKAAELNVKPGARLEIEL